MEVPGDIVTGRGEVISKIPNHGDDADPLAHWEAHGLTVGESDVSPGIHTLVHIAWERLQGRVSAAWMSSSSDSRPSPSGSRRRCRLTLAGAATLRSSGPQHPCQDSANVDMRSEIKESDS